MLLKCDEGLLKRNYVSQLYKAYSAEDREKAMNALINYGLVEAKEMPKPGAKITPVFYRITNKGKAWVKDYLDNYPK